MATDWTVWSRCGWQTGCGCHGCQRPRCAVGGCKSGRPSSLVRCSLAGVHDQRFLRLAQAFPLPGQTAEMHHSCRSLFSETVTYQVMGEANLFNQPVSANHDARAVHGSADCRDVGKGEALIQQAAAWLGP